mmetsp:Transcript_50042/g.85688  ORF Transcript_50042/g.85688 Transcript_50042/m.85688 type:complete len:947 (+) Transcript_50042:79-2919(+)
MSSGASKLLLACGLLSSVHAFGPAPNLARPRLWSKRSVATISDVRAVAAGEASTSPGSANLAPPIGSLNDWEVHKFGGASLATPELYRTVGDLLIQEASGRGAGTIPTMAVVSAMGGMTDFLIKVVDSALVDLEKANMNLDAAVERQIAVLTALAPPEITAPVEARIRNDAKDILSVVQSLRMINMVPPVTMEVVTGFGEIWSAQTLNAYLETRGVPCEWIDAREVLVVKSDSSGLGEKGAASTGGVLPLWAETSSRMAKWWNTVGRAKGFLDLDYSVTSPIVVVTGFVASTASGVPTTLKRSGSDYSATIFAKLTGAGRVTMWKNTDGVYTADPRRVPEAFSIASLKYDEAMELAYFGAQVLHPSAMVPCIDDNIPVYVRNIFNPSFEGTVIQGRSSTLEAANQKGQVKNWRSKQGVIPIKGITSVDECSLVTLEGASVIGGANVAERFTGAMAANGINVLIITQASSDSSICVAVPESQGEAALAALKSTFELELARSTVNSVSLVNGMSIVAIVGEGMAFSSGVSGTFMSALASSNVNVRVIAQGSSERQISVVVDAADTTRALRAVHMAFTLSLTTASVVILGSTGSLGSELLKQMEAQKKMLADDLKIDMTVKGLACSSKMVLSENSRGLKVDDWDKSLLGDGSVDFDLEVLSQYVEADFNPQRIVIDCTNSEAVSEYYERWLSNGISVISPSRKVAAGPIDRFRRVKDAVRSSNAMWQFESSVGSALPILTTLTDLMQTGDQVNRIEGCVSGTFAYALRTFSKDVPFSESLERAVSQGFAEADLREDLSGLDTARKVVILARQIGLDVSIEDVEIESLLPEWIATKDYSSSSGEMIQDLKCIDESMAERLQDALANDAVLRYKFVIEKETGKCKCSVEKVKNTDALYRLKENENLVSFQTNRYTTAPLIVKGASAGPELASAAIFADLLRLARAYSSTPA